MIVLQKDRSTYPAIILTWYKLHAHRQGALVMAATVLIVLPVLLVLIYFQRWIVKGFCNFRFK